MEALRAIPAHIPALYCARVEIVDEDLSPLGLSARWPRPPSFGNALVENIAMGCTIAMNRSAADLVAAGGLPRSAIMHDWWCYLTVAAFGTVVYDPHPALKYRLHNRNSVGLPSNALTWALDKIRMQLRSPTLPRILDQAEEFKAIYGDRLSGQQNAMIEALLDLRHFVGRVAFVGERCMHGQFRADDLALRLLALVRGA